MTEPTKELIFSWFPSKNWPAAFVNFARANYRCIIYKLEHDYHAKIITGNIDSRIAFKESSDYVKFLLDWS